MRSQHCSRCSTVTDGSTVVVVVAVVVPMTYGYYSPPTVHTPAEGEAFVRYDNAIHVTPAQAEIPDSHSQLVLLALALILLPFSFNR